MLRSYLKIALKVLLRRKFFTFISLFGISFTLLVLMIVAGILDNTFGTQAPETRQDRSLGIYDVQLIGPESRRTGTPGYKFLDTYIRTLPNVEKVSIHSETRSVSAFKDGERISLDFKWADGEFWQIMQFKFLEGGPFTPDDERNANFVAVVNQATSRRLFGDSPAVGKILEADGQRFRVVGVVANVPSYRRVPYAEVWVPISTSKGEAYKRELMGNFFGTILARTRGDLPAIRAEVKARLTRVDLGDNKQFEHMEGAAESYFENCAGEIFSFGLERGRGEALILLLIAGAVLFMILPTINLVNLNVSRIMERASEIGVRKAFGASRRALVSQFVVENIALSLAGGLIGFVLSIIGLHILGASGVIPYAEFHANIRIFLYALGMAVFFGLFSGVLPAWKMSRLHPVEALRGRSR